MNLEPDPELASLLDAELKKLPPVPAPRTLVPNVVATLAARPARPWWQGAWWDWPVLAKAAFLLLALSVVAAFSTGGLWLDDNVTTYSQQVASRLTPWTGLWDTLAPLTNAGLLLWEKIAQPVLLHGLALGGALYLICIGAGTALFRTALKRS
jgi:hypothetical protein